MKRLNIAILMFLILSFSLTSCVDRDKKIDETSKFLNENYEEFILPIDQVNEIHIDKYNNTFTLTEQEQAAVDAVKDTPLKVAIPIVPGYLDEVNGEYVGINIFAAMQLEKDLELNFEYYFLPPEEIYPNADNFDIIVGKSYSTLMRLYDVPTEKYLSVSNPYTSISYACFVKDFPASDINLGIALSGKTGIQLPYEQSAAVTKSGQTPTKFPNVIQSNDLNTLMSSGADFLILPENSSAPKYGYERLIFKNYAYEINSCYVFKNGTDTNFINAVNKTITPYKEKTLNEYKNSTDLIKCAEGYYFTDEEIAYLEAHQSVPIITKYRTSSYPVSFYDKENNAPNGKLILLLNRVSAVTGLDFQIINYDTEATISEMLANLYNDDIDLAVGVQDAYDRSFYIEYSNTTIPDYYTYVGYKDTIKSSSDIYNYKIGAVEGSAMDLYLRDKYPTKQIVKYPDIHSAYAGLKNGDVDYIGTPSNSYYYLVNYYNDFYLKIIYTSDLPADLKYAAPKTDEGAILISIIDKVVPRVNPDQIKNINYPLTEVDTVGAYRNIIFYRIFLTIILFLIMLGLYVYYELNRAKKINLNIRSLNNKLHTAFKVSNFSIISFNIEDEFVTIDEALPDILGLDEADIFKFDDNCCIYIETLLNDYFISEESSKLYDTLDGAIKDIVAGKKKEFQTAFGYKYKKDPSEIKYVEAIITSEETHNGHQIVFIMRDATKEALYEKYEQAVSAHSMSTEAKSRISAFKVEVAKYIGNTVAYINIDNFNQVNNVYGHRKGDATIERIIKLILEYDYTVDLYKMNGDEFFVVLSDFNETIAEDFLSIFREDINLNNHTISITASIGYFSIKSSENITNDEIVNISNFAMLQAKLNGKDKYVVVSEQMLQDYKQANKLDALLKTAIANGDIIPYYQPYYNVVQNKIVGYETLMRWKTNDGILSPFLFLSIAIKSGDIYEIDILMFKHSALFLKQLQVEGLADEHFVASSNFTPITLVQVNPLDLVKIVTDIGVSPKNMTIEVTEQLFASDIAFDHIKALKSYGFNIALDDFSVGHSSMAYLKRLSVDVLKLDKTLLEGTSNKTNLDIYKTVVSLGKSLNAKIISEGVETEQELKVLKDAQVTIGQGYFFSRPNDKETIFEYIKEINK